MYSKKLDFKVNKDFGTRENVSSFGDPRTFSSYDSEVVLGYGPEDRLNIISGNEYKFAIILLLLRRQGQAVRQSILMREIKLLINLHRERFFHHLYKLQKIGLLKIRKIKKPRQTWIFLIKRRDNQIFFKLFKQKISRMMGLTIDKVFSLFYPVPVQNFKFLFRSQVSNQMQNLSELKRKNNSKLIAGQGERDSYENPSSIDFSLERAIKYPLTRDKIINLSFDHKPKKNLDCNKNKRQN